jgi:hypothetical protein
MSDSRANDPDDTRSPREEPDAPSSTEEPVCAACGGEIGPDDVICPHCGVSLVAG